MIIVPFKGWKPSDSPSKDLTSYGAYNDIKHDRETQFSQATLRNAFNAVTACFVMLCAQYGWDSALKGDAALRAFFRLTQAPKWAPAEIYILPFDTTYKERSYSFVK
jgi:hypothetical protein